MKSTHVIVTVLLVAAVAISGYGMMGRADGTIHEFERTQLSDVFYAEGGAIGDLNQDGSADVVAGPYWYEGPDYQVRHEYYEPSPFDKLKYSDNFFGHVYDFNQDGWNDILIIGFPGEAAHWFENPKTNDGHWTKHLAHPGIDNESPQILDFTGDGRPEMVFHSEGTIGYASFDPDDPTEAWTFQPLSEQYELGHFTHGFGVGDVNGDGLNDIMMAKGWWENPGLDAAEPWTHHKVDFGPGGAQMYAYDVNGDGMSDVITSLEAHGWGLAWFEQKPDGSFEKHQIMGSEPAHNPYGVAFSQPHGVALVDIDRDGLKDIVTGKRHWAHGDHGDPEPNAPAVLYWFKLQRTEGGVSWIPYQIDDDSGVGVGVTVGELTGDEYPDILIVNKKGAFVFHHDVRQVNADEWEDAQPELHSNAN